MPPHEPATAASRLLVRDLAQVATPAGRAAPLRGSALGDLDWIEDAYVLCEDGRIAAVGPMRDLPAARRRRRGDRRARALRDPGSRRLPHARVLRRRPRRRVLAARGGRDVRGAARGGRRDPCDRRARRAPPARTGSSAARRRHRDWMRAHGTTTFEAKSGYGLDRDTELASLARDPRRGRRPDLARRARRAAGVRRDADAYLDFVLAEVLPEAALLAEAADVFLERGAFDAGAGPPLPRGLPRRRPRAAPARRPVHRVRRDPARDRARRALGRPPRGDRARRRARARRERRRRRAAAGERALPRPADAAGARARRRRRRGRARDRLQPRQRVLREPPARLLARVRPSSGSRRRRRSRPAPSTPRTCSGAPTARAGSPRATTPTSSCSTRPTGATSPTTSGGAGREGGRRRRRATLAAWRRRSSERRREKERRHEYEDV